MDANKPNLSVEDFNKDYLQHLLDKLFYERKSIILPGDFNVDLVHYETDYQTRNFLHLVQFLIYINKSHRNTTISKQLRFKRNLKALSHDAFKKELQKSWHEILKIEDENTDTS